MNSEYQTPHPDPHKISEILIRCARNRGSYMSAHVLLNVLNEFGKRDKTFNFSIEQPSQMLVNNLFSVKEVFMYH